MTVPSLDAVSDNCTVVKARHEVYEDLGSNSNTVLDPGFNMNTFRCLDMVEDHPERFLAMQCSLSGSVNVIGNARGEGSRQSSGQQTPQSNAGLSGSNPVSPQSLLSQATMTAKSPITSLDQQCLATGDLVYECANVGLRSFSPLDVQACQPDNAFAMPPIEEKSCNEAGELIPGPEDLHFPSWDQLPADFQNPTTSADFDSTIPISTMSFTAPNAEYSTDEFMNWDNQDMNFTMDMDMDLDMDLDMTGKC
jgi:hypothetical protein